MRRDRGLHRRVHRHIIKDNGKPVHLLHRSNIRVLDPTLHRFLHSGISLLRPTTRVLSRGRIMTGMIIWICLNRRVSLPHNFLLERIHSLRTGMSPRRILGLKRCPLHYPLHFRNTLLLRQCLLKRLFSMRHLCLRGTIILRL